MRHLLAAELLKTRKRWLPYGLFAVMLLGVSMHVWLAGYVDWATNENDFMIRGTAVRTFAIPWSIPALLDAGQFWGAILVGVLAASVVATEHNWGTVKQALTRGQSRSQYLAVKLVVLTFMAALSLLAALGVGVIFSLFATSLADYPITLDVAGGPSSMDIVLMVLRAGFCVIPYGLLAFCLAVVGRSTAIGAAGVLVYVIGEAIVLAIFNNMGGVMADSRNLFIGHNVNAVMAENRIGSGDFISFAFRENPDPSKLPDPGIAALVLVAYCLLFLGLAFYWFRRRDIRS